MKKCKKCGGIRTTATLPKAGKVRTVKYPFELHKGIVPEPCEDCHKWMDGEVEV